MRTEGRFNAIVLPERSAPVADPAQPGPDLPVAQASSDFDFDFSLSEPSSAAPAAIPSEQPLADIQGIDFDSLSALSGLSVDAPAAGPASADSMFELDLGQAPAPVLATEANSVELSTTDFDAHFLSSAAPQPDPVPVEPVLSGISQVEVDEVFDFAPEVAVEPASIVASSVIDIGAEIAAPLDDLTEPLSMDISGDEQIKVIGSLRIGIPLYNVYLNEADEWSRRLVTEVTEWTMERGQPIGDSALALTHSLAGSSSTVGFDALSEMARALEHALQQSQIQLGHGGNRHNQLFIDAAEDIRRLLHQFAAGFLKQPDPRILQALREIDFSDPVGDPAPVADSVAFPSGAEPAQPVVKSVVPTASAAPASVPVAPVTRFIIKAVTSAPVFVSAAPPKPAPAEVVLPPSPPPAAASAPVAAAVQPSAAAVFSEDLDDEFDAVDAIDPDLFPIFEEEGAELMPQLGAALRQWAARPDNLGARNEVLRALHPQGQCPAGRRHALGGNGPPHRVRH
jgi:chemosensory pili system protein ChpA (sensor histidine kinase/response regulator)